MLFGVGALIGSLEVRMPQRFSVLVPLFVAVVLLGATWLMFLKADGVFPLSLGWQTVLGGTCALSVVACTLGAERKPGIIGDVMERLGDASYSTYLVHPFLLMAFFAVVAAIPSLRTLAWTYIPLGIILSNVAGYVVHRSVERPLTEKLKKRFSRSKFLVRNPAAAVGFGRSDAAAGP